MPDLPEPPDELLRRTRSGDEIALEELLERYLPRMRAFVRARVHARLQHLESCDDLVQSACREVLTALPTFEFRGEAEFRSFLFRAAWAKIVDRARWHGAQQRDAKRCRQLEDAEHDRALASALTPSREAQGREELSALEQALTRLPDDHREAIVLRRIVGLSYAEIAAEMERSEGAVRNLVCRGLARLSAFLDP
jgi:RNA polymerase sigma-70 factor (ECF subfamily)